MSVGSVVIGGDHPIVIQSMTTTTPEDVEATTAQIAALRREGCDLVRIAVPSLPAARALPRLRRELAARGWDGPLVADVHYSARAALEAARHVEKVRINPGNYAADREEARRHLRALVAILRERSAALRIGINHGSLARHIADEHGHGPEGMAASALEYLRICRDLGFRDVVVSAKASQPALMVAANRLLVQRLDAEGFDCPLHLGVTEAGEGQEGALRSAAGLGALLLEGLGDTIRVSLTGDPAAEIAVCRRILRAVEREHSAAACQLAAVGGAPAQPPRWPDTITARALSPAAEECWRRLQVGGAQPPRVELALELPARLEISGEAVPASGGGVAQAWIAAVLRAVNDGVTPAESLLLQTNSTARAASPTPRPLSAALTELRAALGGCASAPPLWIELGAEPDAAGPRLGAAAQLLAGGSMERDPRGAIDGLVLEAPASLLRRVREDDPAPDLLPLIAGLAALRAHCAPRHAARDRASRASPARAIGLRWHVRPSQLCGEPRERPALAGRLARLAGLLCRATLQSGLGAPSFSWDEEPRAHIGRVLATICAGDAGGQRVLLAPRLPGDPGVAAVSIGALLLDGHVDLLTVAVRASEDLPQDPLPALREAYALLQATGRRLSRADFVSCPGCGRLRFDLPAAARRLKAKLGHLRDVRIAVMGCSVNGPGEMAGADFGYVGTVNDRVDLYVGPRRVLRGLSPEEADARLVELIREAGRWQPPS